jgi:hypothetical protein
MHKLAKDMAISQFKKKSVGDVSEEYFKELIIQIKNKFSIVKIENDKESQVFEFYLIIFVLYFYPKIFLIF